MSGQVNAKQAMGNQRLLHPHRDRPHHRIKLLHLTDRSVLSCQDATCKTLDIVSQMFEFFMGRCWPNISPLQISQINCILAVLWGWLPCYFQTFDLSLSPRGHGPDRFFLSETAGQLYVGPSPLNKPSFLKKVWFKILGTLVLSS